MAQFVMTVPDILLPDLLDAFAELYPIPEDDQEPPQPLYTKAQWARLKLRGYVRDVYRAYRANFDAETARQVAMVQADINTEGVNVS